MAHNSWRDAGRTGRPPGKRPFRLLASRELGHLGGCYLCDMIICNVDESGRVLTMSYGGHVVAEEMRRCLGTIRDLMDQLKPGFFLLTDLSNLESMEASCASEL